MIVPQIGPHHFRVAERSNVGPSAIFAAGIHHHAAAAQRPDRIHDMLDQKDGHAALFQRADKFDAGQEFGRIEARQPFVEQQQFRSAASARASSMRFWSI